MFFSLLAASIDGFISGFALGTTGIKFRIKDIFTACGIIFICCLTASLRGKYLAQTQLDNFLYLIGGCIMLWLAFITLLGNSQNTTAATGIASASLSVAADASLACLYLAIYGYNILLLAAISAFLHCLLMAFGSISAQKLIKPAFFIYCKYMAGIFFFILAITKFCKIA